MEKQDAKLLLTLVLHYIVLSLHYVVRLVQRCIVLTRHYIDVMAKSPLMLKTKMCMDRLSKRPWFRKCRNALYHCAAFVVGSTYVDERVAFTAQVLVKNDAYRDRLLVPEIEDLVALCDALRLTLAQRKAYFQCFLHVDFMRRSSVSRAELLRYCNLRSTSLTSFLFPNADEATHRETRYRWDIMQLMAACFSICTADTTELVRLAVAEAVRLKKSEDDESDNEGSVHEEAEKEGILEQNGGNGLEGDKQGVRDKFPSAPSIGQQIAQCLAFFVGVPDPVERSLQALLVALYDNEPDGRELKSGELTVPPINMQEIHRVATIFDVVRLFPVLIFPCIWTQRVLRTRVLGVKTWRCLQQRRMQLQPHFPTGSIFLSVADIIAASEVQIQPKLNRDYQILTPTSEQHDADSAPSIKLLSKGSSSRSEDGVSSTPRKVVPSTNEVADPVIGASSYATKEPSNPKLTFDQCRTSEEAWRVSANHALASVYIQCLLDDSTSSNKGLQAEFEQVTKQIFAGELSTEKSEQIRQRLVKVYGYHFAHSLLAKSSVKEQNQASRTPLDEHRANQRYTKAWCGNGLVEDKSIYWKEFEDPAAKRTFYYNIRTGESRWEMPINFVGKKKIRRRKVKNTEAPPQFKTTPTSPT